MDMEELSLLPSLLPNSYVHEFFHSFELFHKDDTSQFKCQDTAGS